MRVQLALNVSDLDEAVAFYSKLFGTDPHKRRDGYANFAIDEPPLKLVLFENPDATERLNHLGVEVFKAEQVEDARRRLGEAGILERVQRETECCHALQEKVWSRALDGASWEWYRILDDNTKPDTGAPGTVCCAGRRGGTAAA